MLRYFVIKSGIVVGRASKLAAALACLTVITGALAQASSASTGPVPNHVLTADYLRGPIKDTASSPTVVVPWLSWAESSWQLNPAIRAAGIKAMYYTDPFMQNPFNPMYTEDESTFAHTCDGSRIKSLSYENMYLMEPSSLGMRALVKKLIASRSGKVQWDAFFVDNANSLYNLTDLPCNYSPRKWLDATKKEIEEMKVPIVYNGLQIENERELNRVPNVIGGMEEGCYSSGDTRPKIWDKYWLQIENTEIAMAQDKKLFFCLGRDTSAADAAVAGRIYTYASFLLTYSRESSVLWEQYTTASRFRVEPETGLVAVEPVIPTPIDVSGLRLSTGVYGREYKRCYVSGSAVGACAVVVNPDRFASHDYPYGKKYQHSIVLSGGGVMDGGSIDISGPPQTDTLSPLSAAIVFQ